MTNTSETRSRRLSLDRIMAMAVVSDQDVAVATGLHRATISRIRRHKVTPTGVAVVSLDAWVERMVRNGVLPKGVTIDWRWVIAVLRRPTTH